MDNFLLFAVLPHTVARGQHTKHAPVEPRRKRGTSAQAVSMAIRHGAG